MEPKSSGNDAPTEEARAHPDSCTGAGSQEQFRVAEDGSVILRQEGANLRCRFPSSTRDDYVPCSPNSQGELCCKWPSTMAGQFQGEQTSEGINAKLLMEVLDGQKCVASHMLPHYILNGSSPRNNSEGEQLTILPKGGIEYNTSCKGAGSPGLGLKDNPLAAQDDALALEVGAGAEGDPPGDGDGNKGKDDGSKNDYSYSALKPFIIMSSSYLLFTTTDGMVHIVIIFHALNAHFSAFEVAITFMAYEVCGTLTNLVAGFMGAKWGIKTTLLMGLTLQIIGAAVLMAWQSSWTGDQKWKAILFATTAQITVGVAKDLVKLGGKSVTKLVSPDEKQTMLFKLISFITGMKNSLKGVGYIIGAASLILNFRFSMGLVIFLILLAYPWAIVGLSNDLGRTRKENVKMRDILHQNYNTNVLSLARFFLFGSRDLWFEVPLPFFILDAAYGLGWSDFQSGVAMGIFIIVYGQFQSWTPELVLKPLRQMPANKWVSTFWCVLLLPAPIYMAVALQFSGYFEAHYTAGKVSIVITGLALFAVLFAVNSSTHSYLVVRYSDGDKVAMNVGFYYMANAAGRLVGTIVGGALYTYAGGENTAKGLAACYWTSVAFVVVSAIIGTFSRDDIGGLKLGALTLVPPHKGKRES